MAGEGAGSQLPTVAGRRESDGWKVWIRDGDRVIVLESVRARQLARDIEDVCDVIDGRHASGAPAA